MHGAGTHRIDASTVDRFNLCGEVFAPCAHDGGGAKPHAPARWVAARSAYSDADPDWGDVVTSAGNHWARDSGANRRQESGAVLLGAASAAGMSTGEGVACVTIIGSGVRPGTQYAWNSQI